MDLINGEHKEMVANILVSVPEYLKKVHCDTNEDTLPFKCAVLSCLNTFESYDLNSPWKFHRFPTSSMLSTLWKQACRIPVFKDTNTLMVCSSHFKLDDYVRNYKEEFRNPNFKRKLKPEAVPTENLIAESYISHVQTQKHEFEEIKNVVDENEQVQKNLKEISEEYRVLKQQLKYVEDKIRFRSKCVKRMGNELIKSKKNSNSSKEQTNLLSKVFSLSQINKLVGKKKVYWTNDDLAMAFTLRHIGNRECYLYLKDTLNFPLPALSCVQRWVASINP